ncbi:MAG: glycosyltransferase family 2 protein [Pseudomonadota bacterium]
MSQDRNAVMQNGPDISVVVPLFNEEDNVARLYQAIVDALKPTELSYEIIFVDDGSSDATAARVRDLTAQDQTLKLIRFRRNYGQTPAMAAGIDHASGHVLVTMDGDLQNDPLDIPDMVAQISDDVDLVVGWRVKRQDKLISRKIPSMIANRLIGKVTGVPIKDNGCSLKAYKADVIKRVPLYSELHRFIPAMASITGARVKQVPVRHHARQFGESKYGLGRIYRVLFDLLIVKTVTQFAARPLTGFTLMAVPVAALALVVTLTMIVQGLTGNQSLVVWGAVLLQLVGLGVFMVTCGAIGELVFRSSRTRVHELALLTSTSNTSDSTSLTD